MSLYLSFRHKVAQRDIQIKRLRGKNWTLQRIADKYGMSRQRVFQIVGNIKSRAGANE